MTQKFPDLFKPIQIGTHIYKNRIEASPSIFAAAHLIEFPGFKSQCKKRALRMLEAKARGGCASVILGELSTNTKDCGRFPFEPEINWKDFNDPCMANFKANAQAIKKYGAVALAELVEVGIFKPLLPDGIEPLGPCEYIREDGVHVHAFTKEDIKRIVREHVDACIWLKEAGWDGVVIHCGHGWLPAQFLSRAVNKRTDEYGGSLENRARISVEILSAVRKAMGPDFIIEIRVSARERMPGGIELDETIEYCRILEPYVDLIHVSGGHYFNPGRTLEFTTAYAPHGAHVEDAAKIKEAVSVPVAVVGGINSPEYAQKIIAAGKVDMVSLGRQLFADPEFANKAMNGQEDLIRRCLRCGRCYPGAYGEEPTEKPVPPGSIPALESCSINPYDIWPASHHDILPEDMPEPEGSRKVLIAGGGCAGMQAAVTAARRGHKVILAEKTDELGGLLKFTDHSPHKTDIRNFKNVLIREVEAEDIDVRTGCEVTPELISEIFPDVFIAAVGSKDFCPPIPGIENCVTAMEAYYADFENIGNDVIILGGGLVGCELALDLAEKGIHSSIVEKCERLIPDGFGIYRTAVMDSLHANDVKIITGAAVTEIGKDFAKVRYDDGKEEVLKAGCIVLALGRRAHAQTARILTEAAGDIETYIIGDCVNAARIGEAVDSGWKAAMSII